MMIGNYMNGPAGAGLVQDPQHQQQVLEWLRPVGYDVGAMVPPEFGIEQFAQNNAVPQGGALGAMTPQELQQRQRQGIPGGSGWDGVNQKLQYLQQMQKERAAQGRLRASGGQGGGMGAISNAEVEAMRARVPDEAGSGSMFGKLMSMFGNR